MSPSSSAATKTTIVIVSKAGSLSECVVEPNKETTLGELAILLSKKCGYRNPEGFICCHTWRYRNKHSFTVAVSPDVTTAPRHIYVDIWAKSDGRAGQENKYELPPPIDDHLFFGNMALVARLDKENAIDMTIELWNKIYEALFGGFEDLAATAAEDENEVDELDLIPACKKTSSGYLKDGFVVDSESGDEDSGEYDSSDEMEDSGDTDENDDDDDELELEDIGSELSEEDYESSSDDDDDDDADKKKA